MSDDDWMLDYAARHQRHRNRVEDAAREDYLDAQHRLAEMFADVLAKQRRGDKTPIVVGHDEEPPAVRDLNPRTSASGSDDGE